MLSKEFAKKVLFVAFVLFVPGGFALALFKIGYSAFRRKDA